MPISSRDLPRTPLSRISAVNMVSGLKSASAGAPLVTCCNIRITVNHMTIPGGEICLILEGNRSDADKSGAGGHEWLRTWRPAHGGVSGR